MIRSQIISAGGSFVPFPVGFSSLMIDEMMNLDNSTNATIRITDPDFNADLRAGVSTSDEAERQAAYEAAQQWIHDNYRVIPICEIQVGCVYRTSKIAALNTLTDECTTLRYVTFTG